MEEVRKREYKFKNLVLLVLSTFFLIIATYSWFTSNTVVRVSSLDITVQASEGFQISLDAINWKSIINADEILGTQVNNTYPTNRNVLPLDMMPVSTTTSTDSDGFMNMFYGTVITDDNALSPTNGEYVLSASKITETQGDQGVLIAFDLFFKTNFDIYIHLDESAQVIDNAPPGPRADKGMENAARVGFVNQGTIDMSSVYTGDALAAQALKYTTHSDGRNVVIWEPNYLSHTNDTKVEALNMFNVPIASTIWNSRIKYDGIHTAIPATNPVLLVENSATGNNPFTGTAYNNSAHFGPIPDSRFVTTPKTGRSGSTDTGILLPAGVTKMRIYMWLEGQDYDCGDSASGSDIRWDLILRAVKV